MFPQPPPAIPRASARRGQWYMYLGTGDAPIRGTGTGQRAAWIEIDGFAILPMTSRLAPGETAVRITKRPDLATPHIYRASVLGAPLDVRVELVDRTRTVATATLRGARIIHMVVLPNGSEQFDMMAPKMEWELH